MEAQISLILSDVIDQVVRSVEEVSLTDSPFCFGFSPVLAAKLSAASPETAPSEKPCTFVDPWKTTSATHDSSEETKTFTYQCWSPIGTAPTLQSASYTSFDTSLPRGVGGLLDLDAIDAGKHSAGLLDRLVSDEHVGLSPWRSEAKCEGGGEWAEIKRARVERAGFDRARIEHLKAEQAKMDLAKKLEQAKKIEQAKRAEQAKMAWLNSVNETKLISQFEDANDFWTHLPKYEKVGYIRPRRAKNAFNPRKHPEPLFTRKRVSIC